jgi:hypothetical protein
MQKLIPYEQALRLHEWTISWARGQGLIEAAQRQLERERQRLTSAYEFAGIPLDRRVDVRLEPGPDENGMITVKWQEDQDAAS